MIGILLVMPIARAGIMLTNAALFFVSMLCFLFADKVL